MGDDLLTAKIIGCCFKVHTGLGPGFPERVYHKALQIIFTKSFLNYKTEVPFEVKFLNEPVGLFRCDLLIEDRVILELKAAEGYLPRLCQDQVIAYLKASNLKVGLLINFGNLNCDIKRFSL